MTIRRVRVEDAVGMVLGHDLTKVIPGEYKGPAFKKGHMIRFEDIPHLKDIGKEHIYLIELQQGQLHENDAIRRIAGAVAGDNVVFSEPVEGRVNILAEIDGLLKVNEAAVQAVNLVEHAVVSTRHSNTIVKAGEILAGVKVVPLVVEQTMVQTVEQIGRSYPGMISVHPLKNLRVGVIITGNEVFYGRIQDKYAPVFVEKIRKYGATLTGTVYCPDDKDTIREAILAYQAQGVDVIIAAGGMSVDPDDVTPDAIVASGASLVSYGSPVLPGAMFMMAYLGDIAVLGMPACGMYAKMTVFDLLFPRILAGETLNKKDIAAMGYGGLCLNCGECTYPVCPFGK